MLTKKNILTRSALVVGLVLVGFTTELQAVTPQDHARVTVPMGRPGVPEVLRPIDIVRITQERIVLSHPEVFTPEAFKAFTEVKITEGIYKDLTVQQALEKVNKEMDPLLRQKQEGKLTEAQEKELARLESERQGLIDKVRDKIMETKDGVVQFKFAKEGDTAVEIARATFAKLGYKPAVSDGGYDTAAIDALKTNKSLLGKAETQVCFSRAMKYLAQRFPSRGNGVTAQIMQQLLAYNAAVGQGTAKPSLARLQHVERVLRSLNGHTPNELREGSKFRSEFDQTNPANTLKAAETLGWNKPGFESNQQQLADIEADPDAARGLDRVSGMFNRLSQATGRGNGEKDAHDPTIGAALNAWVRAPESLKAEMLGKGFSSKSPKMQEFLSKMAEAGAIMKGVEGKSATDPARVEAQAKADAIVEKFLDEQQAELAKKAEHGSEADKVALETFKREREDNKELKRKLCKNCPELYPNMCQI